MLLVMVNPAMALLFTPGDKVTCVAGNNTTIATFDTQPEAARSLCAVEKVSFSLEDAQRTGSFRQ
ncbi:hypothetical protein OIU92_21240 [Escherichia coli]|nr:hypothetical protein [Escherichia coli]